LYADTHVNTGARGLKQSVGLRPDGTVYYLEGDHISPWRLNKVNQGGTVTNLSSGNGEANLVASTGGDCFVSHETTGEFEIMQYNASDALEYTHTVASPLNTANTLPELNGALNNLAVADCELLATGQINENAQRHQLFGCSDCVGEGTPAADAEMVGNIHHFETWQTYYGPTSIPVYCNFADAILDGSGSSCETGYYLGIREIDVATFNIIGAPLYTGWISHTNEAPADIEISDYTGPGTFSGGKNFHVTFVVSDGNGGWYPVYKLFRIERCKTSPHGPRSGAKSLNVAAPRNVAQAGLLVDVYPNPSSGMVKVELQGDDILTNWQVIDMTGKVVADGTFNGSVQLDLSGTVSTGLYLLQLQNANGNTVEKLLIR